MKKIKDFFQTKTGMHIYSFAKTYVTVFIGIYLVLQKVMSDPDMQTLSQLNLIDVNVLSASAKGAFIAVVRSIYKLLTDK